MRPTDAGFLVQACLILATISPGIARAGDVPLDSGVASLTLRGGEFASGALEPSDRRGTLRWRSPAFSEPFDFRLGEVRALRFPGLAQAPRARGRFAFEMTSGDLLHGSIIGLDDKAADLDLGRFGRIRVDRTLIQKVTRWSDGADLIYQGPGGLNEWRQLPRPSWVEESGQIGTDEPGVALEGPVGLPARFRIECDLSWTRTPDFLFQVGVGAVQEGKPSPNTFRFEVWEHQLVAILERDREADVSSIEPIEDGPGRVRILAFIDQQAGRFQVYSPTGERKADLKSAGPPGSSRLGLRLTNKRGDIRLERIQVRPWDGEEPRVEDTDHWGIGLVDRSMTRGQIQRFDPESHEFVVETRAGETRIAESRVESFHLSRPRVAEASPILAIYQEGTRVSGQWVKVDQRSLVLATPGVEGPFRLPLEGLRSVEFAAEPGSPRPVGLAFGTIELEGLRLEGQLVDAQSRPDQSAIRWQPRAAQSASPARRGVSGRITYRPVAPASDPRRSSPSPTLSDHKFLALRDGDLISAEVAQIDERGVTFQSQQSTGTFVAHDQVKAVGLAAEFSSAISVNKTKRERLLTLPRMQKEDPPTHLIQATNGDFLRGHRISLDVKTLRLRIMGIDTEIPRERIAKIVWFHADETTPTLKPVDRPPPVTPWKVQAIRPDGTRVSFEPEEFAEGTLSGKSEVLGRCRVRPDELALIRIGSASEPEPDKVSHQSWRLQNAPEPKSAVEKPIKTPE